MIKKALMSCKDVFRRFASAPKFGASEAPVKETPPNAAGGTSPHDVAAVDVPTINIIDKSTLLNDKDFSAMVEAVRIQFEKHVAPMWMKGPWKIVVNQPENVGFPVVILDDPDHAGMLGYHTKSPGGKVWARVFVKAILKKNSNMLSGPMSVSSILSHEVIESFCNPNVNMWAKSGDGRLIAYEVVDPVENDCYDIEINDGSKVSVSNFVLPVWFDPYAPSDVQFDYLKKTRKPFVMSKGGYVVVMNPKTGVVQNVFGSIAAEKMHCERQEPHVAARSKRMSSICEEDPETVILVLEDDGDA